MSPGAPSAKRCSGRTRPLSSELERLPRTRRLALGTCLFLITGIFGFVQPFTTPYYSAAGLSKSQIGLITGAATVTAIVLQPLLGRLSDRWDARRPLMIVAACLAALAYLLFRFAHTLPVFLLLTALGVNGFQYLNTVGGVLIGRLAQGSASGGAAYAGYRKWGSVGYVVVALITGFLLPARAGMQRSDLEPVFTFGPLLFLVIAAVALAIPEAKAPPATTAQGADHYRGVPPALRAFFVAYALYQFALYGASAYLALYMKQLGATPRQVSLMFAAGVLCEVLVMSQVGRWTDRNGRKPALTLAFFLMPIRLLLYIPATGPAWVMAVQSLHGLNFGIVGTIAVVYVNDCVTDAQRGTVQALLASISGVGLALGPMVCGFLADRFGIGTMFSAMSGVGLLAAVYLLLRVPESRKPPVD